MTHESIQNAHVLLMAIQRKLQTWNERSTFTLKGVGNLTRADLDHLALYVEYFIKNGGNFQGLTEPTGSYKKVLDAYGVKPHYNSFSW